MGVEDFIREFPMLVTASATLLGGAVAAFITHRLTVGRNGPHAVHWSSSTTPVMEPTDHVKVVVSDPQGNADFHGLYRVDLTVENRGTDKIDEFKFDCSYPEVTHPDPNALAGLLPGVKLKARPKFIRMKHADEDPTHSASVDPVLSPKSAQARITVCVSPFWRKRRFRLSFFVSTPNWMTGADVKNKLELKSKANVELIRKPSREEQIEIVASSPLLAIFAKVVTGRL